MTWKEVRNWIDLEFATTAVENWGYVWADIYRDTGWSSEEIEAKIMEDVETADNLREIGREKFGITERGPLAMAVLSDRFEDEGMEKEAQDLRDICVEDIYWLEVRNLI